MKQTLTVIMALMLAGCTTGGGGLFSLWSAREARSADAARERADATREKVLAAARTEVAKADLAIAAAPQDSLPVQLTGRFVDNAMPLLDQAVGPMPVEEVVEVRKLVADLLAGRADAESRQAAAEANAASLSRRLQEAEARVDAKEAALREAFDRENRLANRYRLAVWTTVGAGILALVFGAVSLYVRTVYGQGLSGVAAAIADLRQRKHPGLGDFINALDVNLAPAAQQRIAGKRAQLEVNSPLD